jgi:hypothetical protein
VNEAPAARRTGNTKEAPRHPRGRRGTRYSGVLSLAAGKPTRRKRSHPDTLNSAHNLAMDLRMLGDARAARDLDQDTLERRRACSASGSRLAAQSPGQASRTISVSTSAGSGHDHGHLVSSW